MSNLLTTPEVASLTRLPEATLRFYRSTKRGGPPSFRLGRRVVYRLEDVENWIEAQRLAESDA